MKNNLMSILAIGSVAVAVFAALPTESNGQAAGGDAALEALITEVTAQQVVIAENQAKIDEKVAKLAEEIRQARIYVARGGGKTK